MRRLSFLQGWWIPLLFVAGTAVAGSWQSGPDRDVLHTAGIRSLTPWILDVIRAEEGIRPQMDWSRPDAPDWEEVARLAASRPTLSGPELILETQHAVVHYTLEGEDAVAEDLVTTAADAIEYVWTREITQMGYPAPLPDDGRGGSDKYDFYFTKQFMTYGYTSGEAAVDDNSRPSYIALATWMGVEETQVTVSHEFFHALHMTMDYKEPTWWLEETATWMEDMVYDDINDYYNYIPQAFNNPETPIDDNSNIVYAYAIYPRSLSERFGVDIIRDIWFATSASPDPEALFYNAQVVESYGADWPTTIHYFRESMLDLDRYEEGDAYAAEVGEVDMSGTFNTYPGNAEGTLTHTAAHMVEFLPPSGYGTLQIDFGGGHDLIASVFAEVARGDFEEIATDTPVGGSKVFTVDGFGDTYDRVVMVVTQTALDGETTYDFSFDTLDWTDGGSTDPSGCSISGRTSSRSGAGTALSALFVLGIGLAATRRRTRR